MKLISVEKALNAICDVAPKPRGISVPLDRAHGLTLLKPVLATRNHPPFNASAMDGYAVPEGDETLEYAVVGESAAGRPYNGIVKAGQAVRIFTGARLPEGASRVILQENVERQNNHIRLMVSAQRSSKNHVRPVGTDFKEGDVLLAPGTALDSLKLALAAAAGIGRVFVARRPRILLLCMGDELVSPGTKASTEQIFESNSTLLCGLIKKWGGDVVSTTLKDDVASFLEILASFEVDAIVTVGGASVGDYDLVRPAIGQAGGRTIFHSVDVKPGKPTSLSILPSGKPILTLPGNPGSALVCANLFLKPLIQSTVGIENARPYKMLACATGLPENGPRESYLRAVRLEVASAGFTLVPLSCQDSSYMSDFAVTNALIRRVANAHSVGIGESCECLLLDSV